MLSSIIHAICRAWTGERPPKPSRRRRGVLLEPLEARQLLTLPLASTIPSPDPATSSTSIPSTPPRPDYRRAFPDPDFATIITRISGYRGQEIFRDEGEPLGGYWQRQVKNRYTTDSAWSIDNQFIQVTNRGSGGFVEHILLDAESFEVSRVLRLPSQNFRWSQDPERPTVQYGFENGSDAIYEYDVASDFDQETEAAIRQIALPFKMLRNSKTNIVYKNGRQYVALFGTTRGGEDIHLYIVDVTSETTTDSRIVATFKIGETDCGLDNPDQCRQIYDQSLRFSTDGNYLLFNYARDLDVYEDSWRLLDVDLERGAIRPHALGPDPANCGSRCLGNDRSLGHMPFLIEHPVFAYDEDSSEVYIVGGSGEWAFTNLAGVQTVNAYGRIGQVIAFNVRTHAYRSLTDPDSETAIDAEARPSHFAATATGHSPYVFVSYMSHGEGQKYKGEILAIRLEENGNSAPDIVRLAHHQSSHEGCTQCQAHVNVSADGRSLMFPSTWGTSQAEINSYVIDIRFLSDTRGAGPDSDNDGVADDVEDGAPHGGDGDNDGTPDRLQSDVTSLPDSRTAGYITLVAQDPAILYDVRPLPHPAHDAASEGMNFAIDCFAFRVANVPVGGVAHVTMQLHNNLPLSAYYSHGGEPRYPDSHWYPFVLEGGLGAEFAGDRLELWLVDGQRGDYDLTADGVVTHFAAPAINEHPQPWRNPRFRMDVDADYQIAPQDALLIINKLNRDGPGDLPVPPVPSGLPPHFLDVNGDNRLSPLDALIVINDLNANGPRAAPPAPAAFRPAGALEADGEGGVASPPPFPLWEQELDDALTAMLGDVA